MPLWKRLGFLFVFVVPALMHAAAWLGARSDHPDLMAWFPLFFLFVLLPIADYGLGHDPQNPAAEQAKALETDGWFRTMTLAALPVQLGVLVWSGWHFAHAGFGPAGIAGWLLSQGIVGGVLAINVAHELIHKDTALERGAGGLLLTSGLPRFQDRTHPRTSRACVHARRRVECALRSIAVAFPSARARPQHLKCAVARSATPGQATVDAGGASTTS